MNAERHMMILGVVLEAIGIIYISIFYDWKLTVAIAFMIAGEGIYDKYKEKI